MPAVEEMQVLTLIKEMNFLDGCVKVRLLLHMAISEKRVSTRFQHKITLKVHLKFSILVYGPNLIHHMRIL